MFFSSTQLSGAFNRSASPFAYCGQYPIPINFNDERGQFNTYRSHCSKLVGYKSYPLVTEKCMVQISTYVIWHAYLAILTPSLSGICLYVVYQVVTERDIVLKRDAARDGYRLSILLKGIIVCIIFLLVLYFCTYLFIYKLYI